MGKPKSLFFGTPGRAHLIPDNPTLWDFRGYNSGLMAAKDIDVSEPIHITQFLDGNTDGAVQGDAMNIQIVPEPASISLLALGLFVVALRRQARR